MNPKSKKITIKQVARAAGVSTQTVSRVLNERPDVAPETRQQILDIIAQLSYQPSALARSLIQQRSYTLGVVIAGLRYYGPSNTLNGITNQAEALGYSLLLKKLSNFETNDIEPILNSLLAQQVDGLIWAVPEVGDNCAWLQNRLPDLPIPIICLTMHPEAGLSIVSVDNYLGARQATEHLRQQGCRHIGHIAGPLSWWEARQRYAGWVDTLGETGLQVSDRQWVEGNWSSASGLAAAQELLEKYGEIDAVFVANDQMALGVLQLAHRRGRRVPDDLAVVGFDNIPESAQFWPPLTTVKHDLQELGRLTVQHVVQMIEAGHGADNGYRPEMTWLKPELIVRESSVRVKCDE